MKLDLHGYTVHAAWKKFRTYTEQSYHAGCRKVTIITGHGVMSNEFSGWCAADPFVVSCSRMNPNTGAWTVTIKTNQTYKKPSPPKSIVDYGKLLRKYSK